MKIEVTGTNAHRVEMFLPLKAGVKFVVEGGTVGEKIARLFYGMNEHIDMVQDRSKFLGAGRVRENGTDITYGSPTCQNALGRDRPDDPEFASALIEELRQAVQEILKRQP